MRAVDTKPLKYPQIHLTLQPLVTDSYSNLEEWYSIDIPRPVKVIDELETRQEYA